jgi:hypothetical protein
MNNPNPLRKESSQEVANYVIRQYFGVTDQGSRSRAIRSCLLGALAVVIPLKLYLRFRDIGRHNIFINFERDEC